MTLRFLKAMSPYLRQVAGLLLIGSLGGLVMNTTVVLPPIFLGRTVDAATAWGEGRATSHDVLWAGMSYISAMALYQGARLVKRWELLVEEGLPEELIRRGGKFAALVELEDAGWDWRTGP